MTSIACPQCNTPVVLGKNFCGSCAFNLSAMTGNRPCPKCGMDNKPSAKFCGGCAHDLSDHVSRPEAVISGEWNRGETEFVRRISTSEMQSRWGGKKIKVPNGSIAVIVKKGEVVEVLQPGQRTTVTMFENLWGWIQGGINASFYLIDCSPIPFVTSMKMRRGNKQIGLNVSIQAYIFDHRKDWNRLNTFLRRVVKESSIVTLQDVHELLRTKIFTKVRRSIEQAEHHGEAVIHLRRILQSEIGNEFGVSFTTDIVPTNSIHTINLQLGMEQLPRVKKCCSDQCKKEIKQTALFCGHCGQQQPRNMEQGQKISIITADHRAIELDLVFQLLGAGDFDQNENMVSTIGSAAAGVVRQMNTEEVLSTEGFRKIESAINEKLKQVLIGFELQKIGVLDVRDKNGQWVLNAQADILRVKDELEVNRQWMEIEGEELDLQALAYDMVLRRQEMQLDLDFRKLELDLEHKRKETAAQIDDEFLRDEMGLNDRVRRADLLSQEANLDIEDAVRKRRRNIAVDQEERVEQRYQKNEDHEDWRDSHARNQEVQHENLDSQHELNKKNMGHEHELEGNQQAHEQSLESTQMDHEISMEKKTVEQNIWIQDQEVDKTIRHNEKLAESNNTIDVERSKVDDEILRREAQREDDVDWMKAQTADKKSRMDIDTALFAEKGQRELEFEDDYRRNEMDQDNMDKAHSREKDAKQSDHDRGMETMQTQMAHDLSLDQQQASHEQSLRKMEQEERLAEIDAEKSIAMNEDRIQAAVDQKAKEEAELRARLTKEMYEGFDQKKDDLFDKILERDAERDRESRKMMGMLAEGLSGAKSREAEAQKEAVKAYKEGAEQAKDMANTSMNTMSHVAGVRADQRPVYTNSKGKKSEQQAPYQSQPPIEHKPERPIGFQPAAQKPAKKEQPKQALKICAKCGKDPGDGKFCEQCAHRQF